MTVGSRIPPLTIWWGAVPFWSRERSPPPSGGSWCPPNWRRAPSLRVEICHAPHQYRFMDQSTAGAGARRSNCPREGGSRERHEVKQYQGAPRSETYRKMEEEVRCPPSVCPYSAREIVQEPLKEGPEHPCTEKRLPNPGAGKVGIRHCIVACRNIAASSRDEFPQ